MQASAWLQCEVKPGMFENEVAICVLTTEGLVLSFFMNADSVRTFAPNKKAIPVEVVARNKEYGVVTLPSRSFEGPNVARVPSEALQFA